MTPKQAEYILAIQQEGSFSLAAKKLFISQPALSQVIKNIESDIGASIFIRRTFPIKLSPTGEKYLETARQIIFLNKNLKREISMIKNEALKTFHFGLFQGPTKDLHIQLLKAFPLDEYSLSSILSGSQHLIQMVLNGVLDIALVSSMPIYPQLEYQLITEDTIGLLATRDSAFSKAHLGQSSVPFFDTKNETYFLRPIGNNTRDQFELMCTKYQISPKIAFESNHIDLRSIKNNIGDYISMYPKTAYENSDWIKQNFCFFDIQNEILPHNSYIIYYKGTTLTPELNKWIDIVTKYYKAI